MVISMNEARLCTVEQIERFLSGSASEGESTMQRSILVAVLAALILVPIASAPVFAQSFPSKSIRFVMPYPSGGSADALLRPLAQRLSETLGQPVIVEPKPGANGIVGTDFVAKSPNDGYTLVLGAVGPFAVSSAMQKLPFDPVMDFAPVSFLAAVPNVLVVHPSTALKSVAELVAYAKSRPGQLNYGSAGVGSSNQLAAELFNLAAGVNIAHVPYKGGSLAQIDLLGGRLTLIFDNLPAALSHIKSGGLKALAVTSLRRQASLPDVPTMDELGYAKFEAASWFGALVPAGTPRPVIDRLNAAIVSAMGEAALRDRYLAQGYILNPGTPEQFADYMKSETAKWHRVVKAAGIKAD